MPGIAIAHGFEYQGKARNQLGGLRDWLLVGQELGNLAPMGALQMGLLADGGKTEVRRRVLMQENAEVRQRPSEEEEEPRSQGARALMGEREGVWEARESE